MMGHQFSSGRGTGPEDFAAAAIPSAIRVEVSNLELSLGLLQVRAALSQIDVPTPSSCAMAIETPPERHARGGMLRRPMTSCNFIRAL
jgi:hypothetical protein